MADLDTPETSEVTVADSDGGNKLTVNADGSINSQITSLPDSAPTAATIVQYVDDEKVFAYSNEIEMATSDTDNPLLLITNPTSSGKTLYLYLITGGIGVENNYAHFKLWGQPTITSNGTSVTPRNRNIGSSTSSVVNVYELPTISDNGNLHEMKTYGQNNNSVNFEIDFALFVPENKSILITGSPKSNSRDATLTVVWAEV